MMKFLKYLGLVLGALVVIVALAWLFRSDPLGPIAGRQLTGTEQPFPADWAFVKSYPLCALESRVDDPHSVTTICFVHDGYLMIPAAEGSTKSWPAYVEADPRVRVKVGDSVYPARATRVELTVEEVLPSMAAKYQDRFADGAPADLPGDIWLFRIDAR
jgi:hypothetical protein